MVSIKDVVRSSVSVPKFHKYLKKGGGHIGRNFVVIAIKVKTIVRKMINKRKSFLNYLTSKATDKIINLLAFCSNYLSSTLVHFKNDLEYLPRGTIRVLFFFHFEIYRRAPTTTGITNMSHSFLSFLARSKYCQYFRFLLILWSTGTANSAR